MVTLAVLRNNHTMEVIMNEKETHDDNDDDDEEEEEEERPRKRPRRHPDHHHNHHHHVRFSEEENRTFVFDNFAPSMTEEERHELRRQIWYTREEFDAFLEDRIRTIRMWRSVNGNTSLIEPYYVVRGLEMYESAQRNGDVLRARAQHVRAVLQEQVRQQQQQPPSDDSTDPSHIGERTTNTTRLDWDALAGVVSQRSAWAMRQASRLALGDALDAREEEYETDTGGGGYAPIVTHDDIVQMSWKRISMPFPTAPSATQRRCYPSLDGAIPPTRAVDVKRLREMNRQLLRSIAAGQQQQQQQQQQQESPPQDRYPHETNIGKNTTHLPPFFESSTAKQQQQQQQQGNINGAIKMTGRGGVSHSNSLSLMLVRGRRYAMMQNNHLHHHHHHHDDDTMQGKDDDDDQINRYTDPSLGYGIRRDSFHGLLRDATKDEF